MLVHLAHIWRVRIHNTGCKYIWPIYGRISWLLSISFHRGQIIKKTPPTFSNICSFNFCLMKKVGIEQGWIDGNFCLNFVQDKISWIESKNKNKNPQV